MSVDCHFPSRRAFRRPPYAALALLLCLACSATPPAAPPPAPTPAPPAAEPDTSFRTTVPPPGPTPQFTGPVPSRSALANGLAVFNVTQGKLPLVTVVVVLRGGGSSDPEGLPGLAGFVGEMLKSGTKTRSAEQLAEEIETLGTDLSVSVDADTTTLDATVLVENLPKVMELLADVVQNAAFAKDEIKRVRAARLTALTQERDSPPRSANRVMGELLYGAHPYGHPVLGTSEAVSKIDEKDLRRHYGEHFRPDNAAIVFAGNITEAEATQHAQRAFAAWKGRAKVRAVPPPPTDRPAKIVLVPKPDAPQSQLLLGHVGVHRLHPDYFALTLCNAILGGQFNSRINMNLREAKGYTYGASSGFAFMRAPGPFYVSTSVRTEVTKPALDEVLKEVELMRTGTATAQELADAVDGYVLSLPGDFETTSGVASAVRSLFVFELPLDYFRTVADKMRAVTLHDVRRVAREHLRPGQLSIVVVGDEARVVAPLAGLGRGEVEVRREAR